MNYVSLYRKYRPKKFSDVIGQDVIVKILQNAIKSNKISHAYLFSGPRGTGKTSIAKIFSKAINCLNNNCDVCDECEVCKANFDELIDIIEIDAASNNGVDEIREIKNNSKLLPTYLKYKVYIIDEVHMLSTSAFNALLKTLEEPPKHVIFILATTEINKIPATVLSRCQKYDFKKINESNITKRLKYILSEENRELSDNIVNVISKLGEGGLRDSINLLDQALSLNKDEITENDIYTLIGDISDSDAFKLFDYVIAGDIKNVVDYIDNIYDIGINIINVVNKLEIIIKDLLIFNSTRNYFKKEYEEELINYSKIDIDLLIKFSDELFDLNYNLKKGNNYKTLIEIYFIRLTMLFNSKEELNTEETNEKPIKTEKIIVESQEKPEELVEEISEEEKNILINNALALANKKEKEEFLIKFEEIREYLTDKKYISIVNLLLKSTPEVISAKNIIFTFNNSFEIVLFDKNIEQISKFLKKIYDKKYDIVAITHEKWLIIKEEYIKNIKNGVVYNYIKEANKNKKAKSKSELQNSIENIFGEEYIV